MNKLLSFEFDEKSELLEIQANKEGLIYLNQIINQLIQKKGNDHEHLMIPSWGGEELSEEKISINSKLIPHVKIYKWEE